MRNVVILWSVFVVSFLVMVAYNGCKPVEIPPGAITASAPVTVTAPVKVDAPISAGYKPQSTDTKINIDSKPEGGWSLSIGTVEVGGASAVLLVLVLGIILLLLKNKKAIALADMFIRFVEQTPKPESVNRDLHFRAVDHGVDKLLKRRRRCILVQMAKDRSLLIAAEAGNPAPKEEI